MSAKLSRAAERDDAAFRARLAPLASEVLPASSAVGPRAEPRARAADASAGSALPKSRMINRLGVGRRVMALSAVALSVAVAGAAVLGAAWMFTKWLSPVNPPVAPIAASGQGHPPTVAAPSDDMIGLLSRRGDAAIADGDIIAARLLYERAAGMGSAKAATSAGKTYDADFLAQIGARGIRADQTAAAAWFRKAAALGDPDARARLARIEGRPQP